ncbi:MAG: Fe2+-dependent dioxygenase [Alphaproteobacteria bacterium]
MFKILPDLLNHAEVQRLRELADVIPYQDGKSTNPDFQLKNNLQPDPQAPSSQESAQLVQSALVRNPWVRETCFPKALGAPLLSKYEPGMSYGEHVDTPVLAGSPPVRVDISCTVFVAEPDSYDGGELIIRLADREVSVKEKPGSAVFYPSTCFHRVAPVTRGTRLVAITFIESRIRDTHRREILNELQGCINDYGAKLSQEANMRLEFVRTNLVRLWYED